jgi:elongator complex protein 3
VRISRVLRDIPVKFITAGLKNSLRGPVKQRMQAKGTECHCIRCREYGHRARGGKSVGEPALKRLDYEVSEGKEIFLSFEDSHDTLFGLLRLRIQNESIPVLEEKLAGKTAIIRELHVYGPEVPLSRQDDNSAQHRGLGKALLKEAERIAHEEFRSSQLFVLSGVGAREYYRTEGYSTTGDYMVKAF